MASSNPLTCGWRGYPFDQSLIFVLPIEGSDNSRFLQVSRSNSVSGSRHHSHGDLCASRSCCYTTPIHFHRFAVNVVHDNSVSSVAHPFTGWTPGKPALPP